MVDDMTPDAETLALTREIIQTDAESQLLRNGLRVHSSGSMPALYFQISVLCDDEVAIASRKTSCTAADETSMAHGSRSSQSTVIWK